LSTKYLSPEVLNERRLDAVRLRLDGHTVAETATRAGLSAPTVSAAWKAFREGGWAAVPVRPRGRKTGQAGALDTAAQQALVARLTTSPDVREPAWSSRGLADALGEAGHPVSARAIEHWLEARDLKPEPLALEAVAHQRSGAGRWYRQQVQPVLESVRKASGAIWQGGVRVVRRDQVFTADFPPYQLYLHGKRGALHTRCLWVPPMAEDYLTLFQGLHDSLPGKPVALVFHGAHFQASPDIRQWLEAHPDFYLINVPPQ
jgi:transposase